MILADFTCPTHGRFEALADADAESHPCLYRYGTRTCIRTLAESPDLCGRSSPWSPSPVRCRVRIGEVVRGTVDRPDSPMFLDTRELGEGMPMEEWRAKRDKVYEERRHKEGKDL